jgi:aminoglycoside phosphotransferase (APT) family kinase protein
MHVAERDEVTRERIANVVHDSSERSRLLSIWEDATVASARREPPTWLHGDFHPANILTLDGRISGVIDFTDLTSGDPATDLSVAWMVPGIDPGDLFGAYGDHDSSLLRRSRGWALSLAVTYIDHGADSETMTAVGRHTLRALMSEAQG